ncbi:MAG: hypothetical protein KJI69_06310 [Patescibacteria group bacterium]|nr:hypothetical protein [Patescibacteria group bacterium]
MRSIKTITTEVLLNDPARITGIILVAAAAESTVTLNDSDDGTGDDRIALKVGANDSKPVFLGDKGVRFDTGVYSTITGAGAVAYIYYR